MKHEPSTNQNYPSSEDWENEAKEDVSIEDLNAATLAFLQAREDYDVKKKASNEADEVVKEKSRQLINLLERAGKKNWEIEQGKAITVNKFQFNTPKAPQDKQAFAKWLEGKYGKDVFWQMFSVNSMSLNSFLKQELENNPEETFPGIQEPTHSTSIQFRRKR